MKDAKKTKKQLISELAELRQRVAALEKVETERKQAEDASTKSEERYKKQFEEAMDAILIADAETGIIVDCNRVASELVGREKSELVGKHQRILHPPEEIEGEFSRTFKQHLKEKEGQVLETQVVTKKGEIKDVAIKASIFELEGQKMILGIFRDVTEQKQAEAALREAEENFRAVAKNANDGILVAVGEGVHAYVNKRAAEITGYSVAELLETDMKGLVHPDEFEKIMERYRKRLAGKPAPTRYETIFIRKDGKSVPVEFTAAKTVWQGEPASVVFFRDITKRKQAQKEAQKRLAETTVLHKVAEVINSTLDLKGVFHRVVEELSNTFGYRLVDIYLLEEDGLRLQANFGYDDKTTIELIPLERGVTGRVARTGQPAFITDVSQDPDYISSYPDITSEICVPVRSGETLLGTLNVECDAKRPLTEDDLQLLVTLSSHIGVAIENARLYEEEQRRSAQRRTIAEVGRNAAAILEMDTLFSQVVELIARNFGYYRVHIFQIDPDSEYAVYKAGTGKAGLAIAEKGFRLKVGEEGLVGWVAGHDEPLLVNDVSREPRYYVHPQLPDTRSELDVPIRLGEKIIGVLDVQSEELGAFDASDLATLETLAHQLAVAMENARLYEETQRLAITDGLTGLYNLRYFYETLENEMQRSERYHHPVSLIILDIDDFKAYNDRYGHLAGDDLLKELAQLISKVTRQSDTLARYGGEEFAIILPETEIEGAGFLAERLLEGVREHRFSTQDGQTIGRITVSLGVATYPRHAHSAKTLVNAADKALLRAKRAGKNRLSVCEEN